MAKLVRHDTVSDEGLERFTVNKIIAAGLDSHARAEDVIDVIFRFVQSIPYIYDPAGSFDSVQNARHTLAKGYGDCDDLSVLLATMLALVGYKPRFVLARYKQATLGFDHVYVDVVISDKAGERRIALDPCSRSHGMAWESRAAIEKLTFPIFAGRVSNTLGAALGSIGPLVTTGAQIGVGFIPVVGPILSSLIGPISGLFNRSQQRSEETARDEWKRQVHDGMLAIQKQIDSCKISASEGVAAAKQLVEQYYRACDETFTKSSVAKSCRNAETEAGGFAERTARMATSGQTCNTSSEFGVRSAESGSMASLFSAGGDVNWPMLIVIGGVAYFVFFRK